MSRFTRRTVVSSTAALLIGTGGCMNFSRTTSEPTLTGVFITNRDPEVASVHVRVQDEDAVVHEETLEVAAYDPSKNWAGNATVPPSAFTQTPGEWVVSAEFTDGSDSGSIRLTDVVPDDDSYAVVVRIEDDELSFGHGTGFFAEDSESE